jgi:hypothetical protein
MRSTSLWRARAGRLLGSTLFALASACGEVAAPDPPADVLLEMVEGDAQEALVGTPVPELLAVRVVDAEGVGSGGVAVEWAVSDGEGSIEPLDARSDSTGLARARWTLGERQGSQSVRASAGDARVSFVALATPQPPEDWASVVDFEVSATVDGDTIRSRGWIVNRWPGTLRLTTGNGCLTFAYLDDAQGETVGHRNSGCTAWIRVWTIPPLDSLDAGTWDVGTSGLEPGEYTVRYEIAEGFPAINDRRTAVAAARALVVVRG